MDKAIYANDLLHRNPGFSFDETVIDSKTLVEFKDGGDQVVAQAKKLVVEDAYKNIRAQILENDNPDADFLTTTTEKEALTSVDRGTPIFDITLGRSDCFNNDVWISAAGAGVWETTNPATVQTTDDTETTIDSIPLEDNSVVLLNIRVIAVESDGSDRGAYIKTATAYRDGGGAIIQGSVVAQHEEVSDSNWIVNIDASGNDARVRVTGSLAQTIDWTCVIEHLTSQ